MNIEDYFEFIADSWLNVLNNSSFNYVEVANRYNLYPDFLYAFHGKIIEDINIGGKTYPRESMEYDSLRFKLALNVVEVNDEFVISMDYNDAIYSKDYIYKADVTIVTDNQVLEKRIVGKNSNNLITIDNEYIPISIIRDIYKS